MRRPSTTHHALCQTMMQTLLRDRADTARSRPLRPPSSACPPTRRLSAVPPPALPPPALTPGRATDRRSLRTTACPLRAFLARPDRQHAATDSTPRLRVSRHAERYTTACTGEPANLPASQPACLPACLPQRSCRNVRDCQLSRRQRSRALETRIRNPGMFQKNRNLPPGERQVLPIAQFQ